MPGGQAGRGGKTTVSDDALERALQHPINSPQALLTWWMAEVAPGLNVPRLGPSGGNVCDFRPGHEEKSPSLSIRLGHGGTVVTRHGDDGFQGGAVKFSAEVLGISVGEAAKRLIERAGFDGEPAPVVKHASSTPTLGPLSEAQLQLALRGWVPLTSDDCGPEVDALRARGLVAALDSGLLVAYRFIGHDLATPPPNKVAQPNHVMPGAIALAITGPDDCVWAIKARNPGSKAELDTRAIRRYTYLTDRCGSPAWCTYNLLQAASEVWVEGELNAVAVVVSLVSLQTNQSLGVQGIAGTGAMPHLEHIGPRTTIYIYADPVSAGGKADARARWERAARERGATVHQLPAGIFGSGDACDALAAVSPAELGHRLTKAIKMLTAPAEEIIWVDTAQTSGYTIRGGRMCFLAVKSGKNGEPVEVCTPLAEFAAYISAEITVSDGANHTQTDFEIIGFRPDGKPMTPQVIRVPAQDFQKMDWVIEAWGHLGLVHAGYGVRDRLRAAIQRLSQRRGVERRTVHQHTGWIDHPEHGPVYLTADSVIGKNGVVKDIGVELPGRLKHYALPAPPKEPLLGEAVRTSLDLALLAPPEVGVPLLGAIYRSVLGRVDTSLWLLGETGRQKTAIVALAQAHFGSGWTRQHLPDGWHSSANALEMSAFCVKNAIFAIDDFKPQGSAGDISRMQATAARLVHGAADGQGRATLTSDRRTRPAPYPRGLLVATAETPPTGHSNTARMILVNVARPLIHDKVSLELFCRAEDLAGQGIYAQALSAYIQFIACYWDTLKSGGRIHRENVRALAPIFSGDHARTGPSLAELAYGWRIWLTFCLQHATISVEDAQEYWELSIKTLSTLSSQQSTHVREEKPVLSALRLLDDLLSQGSVHVIPRHDDQPLPTDLLPLTGWQSVNGGQWMVRPGSRMIGWSGYADGHHWLHLLPDLTFQELQQVAYRQGRSLPPQKTLWSDMRDLLLPRKYMRCDIEIGRTRWSHSIQMPGGRRRVLTIRFPIQLETFDLQSGTSETLELPSFTPIIL